MLPPFLCIQYSIFPLKTQDCTEKQSVSARKNEKGTAIRSALYIFNLHLFADENNVVGNQSPLFNHLRSRTFLWRILCEAKSKAFEMLFGIRPIDSAMIGLSVQAQAFLFRSHIRIPKGFAVRADWRM